MIATSRGSTAVIGAGPGGLASAVLLAASGVDVDVYEAGGFVGGRSSAVRSDGFTWDRGPTFFLMPYVLDEIFAAAGRRLADYADLTRLDPMYRLVVGSPTGGEPTTLDATQDLDEMARRIGALDPSDGEAFTRFIAHNRAKLSAAEPILRRSIGSPLDLVRPDAMRAAPLIKPHLTVHGLLSKYFRHPAVQLAVSFQSKYLGMSPYDCPSLFTILPFIEYEYGVWHPAGGCNALMDALAALARELGVRVHTDAPVSRVVFDGKRVAGVEVRGGLRRHADVVINADAAWALRQLIPERLRGGWTDGAIERKRYSCSTAMLYLGIDGDIDLPHHTIYISKAYRDNLNDIRSGGRLSKDPSAYVCNPSPIDPSMAPPGRSSLYVLMPTPNTSSGIDWDAERGRVREMMVGQLRDRFGIADIDRRIVCEELATPADWRGQNIQFGATFNLAHDLGQMLHKRVPHRLPSAEGVWFVGGGTHPGSGLPVIFLSAQITTWLLCERLGVTYAGDLGPRGRPAGGFPMGEAGGSFAATAGA